MISDPPFQVILIERWNAPAHRYFLSYSVIGDFRHVLGLPVIDEFATFSSPIFLGPKSLLGQLYNVGITLGHQRNLEMPLDQGWPPLCIGTNTDQKPSPGWEVRLLDAIKSQEYDRSTHAVNPAIQVHRMDEITFYATDLPLLPRQLRRLARQGRTPFTLAFSTGNRIAGTDGKTLSVKVASEAAFEQLLHRFSTDAPVR